MSEADCISASEVPVYDSGRTPLWLRFPATLSGLLLLGFGSALVVGRLLNVNLGPPLSNYQDAPWFFSIFCFVLGTRLIILWHARSQVLLNVNRHELTVRSGGLFRMIERRFSLTGTGVIQIRQLKKRGNVVVWNVRMLFIDTHTEDIARSLSLAQKDALVVALEAATGLPVQHHP